MDDPRLTKPGGDADKASLAGVKTDEVQSPKSKDATDQCDHASVFDQFTSIAGPCRKQRNRAASESSFFSIPPDASSNPALKDLQKKFSEIQEELRDSKYEVDVARKCLEAKITEADRLVSLRHIDKIDLGMLRESQTALATSNELLHEEIEKRDSELKVIQNKFVQQKKELKKLHEAKDKLMKSFPTNVSSHDSNISKKQKDTIKQSVSDPQKNPNLSQVTVEKEGPPPRKNHQIQVVINGNAPVTKALVYVIGDTGVRGLGSRIQSKSVEGQVVVRAGQSIEDAEKLLEGDFKKVADGSSVVIGYGTDDPANGDSDIMTEKFEKLIKTVEWENLSSRINVGILMMPPQKHHLSNRCAVDVNNFLVERCKSANIKVINPNLSLGQLSQDGIHTNSNGKDAVAQRIRRFAIQPQCV